MPQTKCIWDLCIETVERAEMGQDTGNSLIRSTLVSHDTSLGEDDSQGIYLLKVYKSIMWFNMFQNLKCTTKNHKIWLSFY